MLKSILPPLAAAIAAIGFVYLDTTTGPQDQTSDLDCGIPESFSLDYCADGRPMTKQERTKIFPIIIGRARAER
jgi:hypothetical protein